MARKKIWLDLATVERELFAGEVDAVTLPGAEGEMGVLPGHAPLITMLVPGELRVRRGGMVEYFAVGGGVAEVLPNRVVVMADVAERAEEIDIARAEEARRRAEELLARYPAGPERARVLGSLRRSRVRLRVARRARHWRDVGKSWKDVDGRMG